MHTSTRTVKKNLLDMTGNSLTALFVRQNESTPSFSVEGRKNRHVSKRRHASIMTDKLFRDRCCKGFSRHFEGFFPRCGPWSIKTDSSATSGDEVMTRSSYISQKAFFWFGSLVHWSYFHLHCVVKCFKNCFLKRIRIAIIYSTWILGGCICWWNAC